jgi:hypothetical protein
MIPVSAIPDHAFTRARLLKPEVTRRANDTYVVRCAHGHLHTVRFENRDGDLYVGCDPRMCPSRCACYHLAAAFDQLELDYTQPGTRVLVCATTGGLRWQEVVTACEGWLLSREEEDGDSLHLRRRFQEGRMSATPYCKFCMRSCFVPLSDETPKAILEAYGRLEPTQRVGDFGPHLQAATCAEGQAYERFQIGYSWRDVRSAIAILKLLEAIQQFRDAHGDGCHCAPCTFAQAAIWNAENLEVIST